MRYLILLLIICLFNIVLFFSKEDGVLRTMNSDKLLKTLPVLQSQLDALLEFDCTAADLTNGVINMAFMLLFRDLIRLFAGYNDSIINLLGTYNYRFNWKQCWAFDYFSLCIFNFNLKFRNEYKISYKSI